MKAGAVHPPAADTEGQAPPAAADLQSTPQHAPDASDSESYILVSSAGGSACSPSRTVSSDLEAHAEPRRPISLGRPPSDAVLPQSTPINAHGSATSAPSLPPCSRATPQPPSIDTPAAGSPRSHASSGFCAAEEAADEGTEFWFADSGSTTDAESAAEADGNGTGAPPDEERAWADAAAEAPDSPALLHVALVTKSPAHGFGTAEVWLVLTACHSASPLPRAVPPQRGGRTCSIPFDVCTTAAATFGAAGVLPRRPLASPAAAGSPAEPGALEPAPCRTRVWQLPGTCGVAARALWLSCPDEVRIPEGTILAIGDREFDACQVDVVDTCFTGGTIVMLGAACCVTFDRCAFVDCAAVVIGSATATFSDCTFSGCSAPAITASGRATSAVICGGPDGEPTRFRACCGALAIAEGASGHVADCDVTNATTDCFTTHGASSWLALERCTVRGVPPTSTSRCASPSSLVKAWGVSAAGGASVTAHGCKFAGMSGGGVRVQGGAVAAVSECESADSRRAGFMARAGGRLRLRSCRSVRDSREAVLAEGLGSEVHADEVTVTKPAVDGITARTGARAWLHACDVEGATDMGVLAQGPASRVWLRGCRITMCTCAGVASQLGAAVELRGSCVEWMEKDGVHVSGEQATFSAVGCKFRFNRRAGVAVAHGAAVSIRECAMEGNGEAGCSVKSGGALTAHACESREEMNGWLLVSGEGSTACARDCMVARARSSAVIVAKGASVQLHACTLTQPLSHGASVHDATSVLGVNACTICESGGCGVSVADGGTVAMHGTTIGSSGDCGVEASSDASLEMNACVVHGSAEAALRVQHAAVAVVRSCMLTSAATQGLHARFGAVAIATACTLGANAIVGILSESGAMVVASNCDVTGSAVNLCVAQSPVEHAGRVPVPYATDSDSSDDGSEPAGTADAGPRLQPRRPWAGTALRGHRRPRTCDKAPVLIIDDPRAEAVPLPDWGFPHVEYGAGTMLVRNSSVVAAAYANSHLVRQLRSVANVLDEVFRRAGCFREEVVGCCGVAEVVRQAVDVLNGLPMSQPRSDTEGTYVPVRQL